MNRDKTASGIKRVQSLLQRIEEVGLVLLFTAILAMAVIQIVLRNAFDSGIIWGDILVRILVLWIGMVGAMVASRRGEHIRIDLLTRYLPSRARQAVNAAIAFITAAVCAVASVFSFKFIAAEYAYGGAAFAAVPVWVCALIIPLGFFVIAVRYALLGVGTLAAFE